MNKILVTGSTGQVGRKTLELLLKVVPASQLVGLARDPGKAGDLAAKGIEIREGDYFDRESLVRALKGIDKLMLISAPAFTDRSTQHHNAITVVRQTGVKHVVYTSIMRKAGSGLVMAEVTESDLFTEKTLRASDLAYTIMYHPPFMDVMPNYTGVKALEVGVRVPAGSGKVAAATRDELAAANVAVLTQPGHENMSYSLGGNDAASFHDIAEILSDIGKKPVPHVVISEQQYSANHVAAGLPPVVADFLTGWVVAINDGEYAEQTGDLERLIGRKTTTFREYFRQFFFPKPEVAPQT